MKERPRSAFCFIRQQKREKKAFLWVFVAPEVTVYRYATTRSGSVPRQMLGDSAGRLVVDQYTGYNYVTAVGKRVRAGCLAHARRKLFEQSQYPEVEEALALIGGIYRIEADSRRRGETVALASNWPAGRSPG